MKENFTSINIILDKSGSMAGLISDTIGGFNKFLNDQKALPGEAVFTLCTFDSSSQIVHNFKPIASVPDLDTKTYVPGGGTALLDAMGSTINSVGSKLAAMMEDDRPSKVLFLVITDGEENSSREFTKAKIKEMVEHQTNVYNWQFIFLGANIDAISEGNSLGFSTMNSMNYSATPGGTHDLYKTISTNTTNYRSTGNYHGNSNVPATNTIIIDPNNTTSVTK